MEGGNDTKERLGTIERAQREKTFEECSIEEKIERLRQQARSSVLIQVQVIEDMRARLDALESHQHGQDGRLLVGLRDARHRLHRGLEAAMRDPLA